LSYQSETPFDSIESSHEYIVMLSEANAGRRKQALQLVSFNLSKLNSHITASRRVLNDLRTLRRLLLEERIMVRRAGTSG
jgi:hypothetical protein